MDFRRRQFLGWGILAVSALAAGLWLLQLNYARKISSNVLDLIPPDPGVPELALVRQLASQAEARTMLIVLANPNGTPVQAGAAQRFATVLRQSPAFAQVQAMSDSAAREALGHELFAERFSLLFPHWLAEHARQHAQSGDKGPLAPWLAKHTASELDHFLATPEAVAFQEMVPADPLLLMPSAINRLKGALAFAGSASGANTSAQLIWGQLTASPLSEAGQDPAFTAIADAAASLRSNHPGLSVTYTGINRFAAASRARIQHEVSWLNLLSLAAVLAVTLVFIRNPRRVLHLAPVILIALLGAWTCVTLAFDRVHILVFVVGSLLTGVAVDYGFYLYMQPLAFPEEDYWAKVRRLAKPLLASCFTTVAGFALLLFSDLRLIRQLGLFVSAGLLCALGAAVMYFATVRTPFLQARPLRAEPALPPRLRSGLRRVLVLIWLAALPGLLFLQWRDDVRELELPAPQLKQEDARIRALFGERPGQTVYLTYGSNLAEARQHLAWLWSWLRHGGSQPVGLGTIIPTLAEYTKAAHFVRDTADFPAQLRAALDQRGFQPDKFAPFFADYARFAARAAPAHYEQAISALQTNLTGPLGLLLHPDRPFCWFVTIVREAPAAALPADVHTLNANQLQSLNRVFSRYRASALRLSLLGLSLIGAGVLLTYGWRDGVRIFAIPCGACLGVFGFFGWLGQPLNLFHLFGAFLGVCLTHGYSIFTATSAYRREPPPISVQVSALTTATSFGVLALSGIPVVRALGSTVALMVTVALLAIEFEHLSALGKRA